MSEQKHNKEKIVSCCTNQLKSTKDFIHHHDQSHNHHKVSAELGVNSSNEKKSCCSSDKKCKKLSDGDDDHHKVKSELPVSSSTDKKSCCSSGQKCSEGADGRHKVSSELAVDGLTEKKSCCSSNKKCNEVADDHHKVRSELAVSGSTEKKSCCSNGQKCSDGTEKKSEASSCCDGLDNVCSKTSSEHGKTVGDYDACCDDGCCEGGAMTASITSIDANPSSVGTANFPKGPVVVPATSTLVPDTSLSSVALVEVVVHDTGSLLCQKCDPDSSVPHAIQVTRLRVANLCCAGEEKIIRSTLECIVGVEHVAVNVIGRYAIVKHCAVACCAPATKLVDLLNVKHLGASLQEVAGAGDEENEAVDWLQVAHVTLTSLLFLVGLALHLTPSMKTASDGVYLASTGLGVLPILYACYVTVVRRTIDIHILMVIAVVGAVAADEYFDASLLVALFTGAELVESLVMMRVRKAVRSTSTAMAKEAFLSSGAKVKVEDLKVGDVLAVRAGEMILGDGVVTKGEGVVDESALTGESVPIRKLKDSVVMSGTVVQNGFMEIRLTADSAHSTLSRLNQAVLDVQADRGEYAKMIDQFSLYWTPGVLVAALLLTLLGGGVSGDWYLFVHRSLILLVLACPCAIVIAAPIPSVCAIASAAKNGVLIKGSSVIERMGVVNAVAVDKTGTLTKGFFKVSERLRLSQEGLNSEEVDSALYDPMQLAAAIEQKSTHPLSSAVVAEFCGCVADMAESDLKLPNVRKIQVVDGVGVSGWVEVEEDWKFVAVGNEKLLRSHGGNVYVSPTQQHAIDEFMARSTGCVVLFVAVDDSLDLALSLMDEVRPEAETFVDSLHTMGMGVSLVTGDHQTVAADICKVVGIPPKECFSRLLPSEKLDWIRNKQKAHTEDPSHRSGLWSSLQSYLSGRTASSVVMVGDGINDSTALMAASVGVAMGAGGSAMAVASADVVLMSDNLLLVPSSIKLCQMARWTMIQGFVFAIAVKIAAIVLAIMGRLEFWQAIVVDIGTLVVVVANGLKPLYTSAYKTRTAWNESNV